MSDLYLNFEHPTHEGSRIVFLHVFHKADRRGVPPARPYAALNFKGDFVFRYGVIKTPLSDGVELELFDTHNMEVGLANGREYVS